MLSPGFQAMNTNVSFADFQVVKERFCVNIGHFIVRTLPRGGVCIHPRTHSLSLYFSLYIVLSTCHVLSLYYSQCAWGNAIYKGTCHAFWACGPVLQCEHLTQPALLGLAICACTRARAFSFRSRRQIIKVKAAS